MIRDGVRIKLSIPVGGRADLLTMRPQPFGWTDEPGFIEGQSVIRTWDWPLVKQPEFGAEIERFKERLQFASQMIEVAAEKFLVQLREEAATAIRERMENVLARRSFIEDLPVPVLPREGAPTRFTLPPLVAKATPAVRVTGRAPQPLTGPLLGELYEHILSVITAMGTGMERVPAAYADTVEETLRDYLLVVLNTHYEGQAQAEAFNKSGKTDVLIRVQNQTLFVGECKWWSGISGFGDALDQLKSYSTWRDSRLALIVFVPNAGFHDVVDKARIALEARDEFVSWHSGGGDSEIRCKITWPDDPGRTALLAVMFFHLPRSS